MSERPRPVGERVLVLLHAFPLDRSIFDDVAGPLAEAGWDIVAPDLRGFGQSRHGADGPDEEPSLAAMARDVLAILDRVGAGPVVLAGVSMGGYVALELLRLAPERVAALALLDTRATADDAPARAHRLQVADQVLATGDTAALARTMVPDLLGSTSLSTRPAVVDRVTALVAGAEPVAVAWAQRAMAARPDSLATLAAFPGPVLLVRGEQDTISSDAEQALMLRAAHDARLCTVADAGHLAVIERPDAVALELARFLRDLSAAAT